MAPPVASSFRFCAVNYLHDSPWCLETFFSVTLQQQSLHLQMKEWTVDISTTLTAGLIGSLIGSIATACLTYLVQQKLAAKRREEEERRLAFVYLVQITPFVATEQILKNLERL